MWMLMVINVSIGFYNQDVLQSKPLLVLLLYSTPVSNIVREGIAIPCRSRVIHGGGEEKGSNGRQWREGETDAA